jgi:hypothetical protein
LADDAGHRNLQRQRKLESTMDPCSPRICVPA